MTLEQINEITDKDERLKLLKAFIDGKLSEDQDFARSGAGNEPAEHLSRDEAGGMMSRFGKPDKG